VLLPFGQEKEGIFLTMNEVGYSPRPGFIEYFVKHCILINNEYYEHWFAFCKWFMPVQDEIRNRYGKPVEVWQRHHFENMGPASFIPLQRIFCKGVYCVFSHAGSELIAVIPRVKHSLIPASR